MDAVPLDCLRITCCQPFAIACRTRLDGREFPYEEDRPKSKKPAAALEGRTASQRHAPRDVAAADFMCGALSRVPLRAFVGMVHGQHFRRDVLRQRRAI